MNLFKKLAGNGIGTVIKESATLIDDIFTNDEERAEQKRLLIKSYLEDKSSAREMYKIDNSLQKIFALVFLAGYLFITSLVIYILFSVMKGEELTIPDWGIALINMIFGGMSAKVNTIVDFLFGSSQGSHVKDILRKNKAND